MHGIALAQAILLDLAHRNIHIVRAWQIAGGADERVRIQHVDDTCDRDELVILLLAAAVVKITAAQTTIAAPAVVTIVTVITVRTIPAIGAVIAIISVVALDAIIAAQSATTSECTVVTGVFLVLLRRQARKDIVKIAHCLFFAFLHARIRTTSATVDFNAFIATFIATVTRTHAFAAV